MNANKDVYQVEAGGVIKNFNNNQTEPQPFDYTIKHDPGSNNIYLDQWNSTQVVAGHKYPYAIIKNGVKLNVGYPLTITFPQNANKPLVIDCDKSEYTIDIMGEKRTINLKPESAQATTQGATLTPELSKNKAVLKKYTALEKALGEKERQLDTHRKLIKKIQSEKPNKLKSRKFWVAVFGIVYSIISNFYPELQENLDMVISIALGYVGVQGVEDIIKKKKND